MDSIYDLLIEAKVFGKGGGGGTADFCDPAWPSGKVSSDTLITGWDGMFQNRSGITSISLPNLTRIEGGMFKNMENLESLYVPNANAKPYVADMIADCPNLKMVVLPKATNELYQRCFNNDASLEIADLGTGRLGSQYGFQNCASLKTIILRNASVVVLNHVNWFNGTPFASGGSGGTIYVPSALISSYQAAANWSTVNGYGTITWKAIEGSYYETHYADGTPIA